MRICSTVAFILLSIVSYSQKSPIKFGDIPLEDLKMAVYEKDSSASAVVLADFGESIISYSQGNGFQLIFDRIRRIKILTKEGLEYANFSIPLYHNNDLEEKVSGLKVVTYNLENGKTVETKAKGDSFFKEKIDQNVNVTKITWQNVKVGSVLEIAYRVTSDFIFNFQDWEFQSDIPTRWSEYRARIPEYFNYEKYMQGYITLDVSTNELSQNSFTINYRSNAPGGREQERIDYSESKFRWAAKDIPAFKEEPYMTNTRDYLSKINFELSYTKFPNEFSNPGIKQYMGSWEDINKSYWDVVDREIKGNNSLKKFVEEIVGSITDPEQKMIAIFEFVRKTILWDEHYGKYFENSVKQTLDQKRGNVAEINVLLASLLEKADIKVNMVLLSTRDHGFVRESYPISSQFNYVVCLVDIAGKSYLLDATDKYCQVGLLPQRCINGNGFVVAQEGFKWVNLSSKTKTRSVYSFDVNLTESADLKGTLKIDRSGYYSADARRSYLKKGEKEYLKEFVNGRPWQIEKSEFQNIEHLQLPFKESHEVIVSEYITQAGDALYFSPLLMARIQENPFKFEKRVYPIDFTNTSDVLFLAKIKIPEGFQVDELPQSKVIALPQNFARYTFSVSQTGNSLSISSNFVINKSLFTPDEYEGLREFYNQVVAKQAEQIVLKKK